MNARNRLIVEARAAGRPVQAIALEHGLSVARVSRIVQDHRKDVEVARLKGVLCYVWSRAAKVEHNGSGADDAIRDIHDTCRTFFGLPAPERLS
jgi:hypothetical protein